MLSTSRRARNSAFPFLGLIVILAGLWLFGGASRADVLGQTFVRAISWVGLVAAILFTPKFDWRTYRGPAIILVAVIALPLLQLFPLPPEIWSKLPGRAVFVQAASVAGIAQPWRPISLSPSGTVNALNSLIVPVAVFVLASQLAREQHWRVATIILGIVLLGTIQGLLQFAGSPLDNPLINSVRGAVSGNFANRNHFALFLAIGCVLTVVQAVRARNFRAMAPVASALLLLLLLTLLATGSRTGLLLALVGLSAAVFAVKRTLIGEIGKLSGKILVGGAAILVAVFGGVLILSVQLDRAASIERASSISGFSDMRMAIWPVVTDMTGRYFPFGSGFGTFDPVYRVSEPNAQLGLFYINHAHNDFLEVLLDGGAAAALLLLGALGWFGRASLRAWRRSSVRSPQGLLLARIGSLTIFLVLIASVFDYPARTPMVMALLALSAVWLCRDTSASLENPE